MIPTFGQADVLASAIESALAQDYQDLEVVISDDASPDDTPALVMRYAGEPRVRYVRSPINRGRVRNYRHTLENLARGDFVLNLDGDDWLSDPTYISDAVGLITDNPDLVMVFARSRVYDQSADAYYEVSRNANLPTLIDGTDLLLAYADGNVSIPHMTALYRRDVALKSGFYTMDVTGADSIALLSILPGHEVGFIDRTVAVWRKHTSNATWNPDVAERLRNYAIADVPAAIAQDRGALGSDDAKRWRRGMAIVVAQSFVEDCLVRGMWWNAARFLLATGVDRPTVSAHVIARVVRKGVQRVLGGKA